MYNPVFGIKKGIKKPAQDDPERAEEREWTLRHVRIEVVSEFQYVFAGAVDLPGTDHVERPQACVNAVAVHTY